MLTAFRHHVPALLAIVILSIAQFGIVFWYLKVALQYQPKSTKRTLAWVLLMTAIAVFPFVQLIICREALKFERFDNGQAHLWVGAQAAITIILILVFLIRKEVFGKK
jgi:hypothetical protein